MKSYIIRILRLTRYQVVLLDSEGRYYNGSSGLHTWPEDAEREGQAMVAKIPMKPGEEMTVSMENWPEEKK